MSRNRRRQTGDTEWIGATGEIIKPAESSLSQIIAGVRLPGEDVSIGQTLPEGTLLRTLGNIGVSLTEVTLGTATDDGITAHCLAALHTDEAVKDDSGALNVEPVQLSQEDNLGFEGLFWLGSAMLWKFYAEAGEGNTTVATQPAAMMRVDSKAKRKLFHNDCIILDLANIPLESEQLVFTYDLRFLIKRA